MAHAAYLDKNSLVSHYEEDSRELFYEETPLDRTMKALYAARYVSENVSGGQVTVQRAIDDLLTAIYHRFVFIDPKWNEIGIGIAGSRYVFDVGNTNIRSLCEESMEEREEATQNKATYRTICLDTDKWIAVDEFQTAVNLSPALAYVLYPPAESTHIPPAFFEESPDPLPHKSYSGNPVSVTFNPNVVSCEDIRLQTFTLKDEETGENVEIDTLMDKNSDPNERFTECDFAVFPSERLQYGHGYQVLFVYKEGEESKDIAWHFQTLLPGTILEVDSNDMLFEITSGMTYYIYISPTDDAPAIGSSQWSAPSDVVVKKYVYYDANTIEVLIEGTAGKEVTVRYQDDKEITLRITE